MPHTAFRQSLACVSLLYQFWLTELNRHSSSTIGSQFPKMSAHNFAWYDGMASEVKNQDKEFHRVLITSLHAPHG
jgi:hypothetical protein